MGVAQVFVGKIFVHRLQSTKSMKILPLENYPLHSMLINKCFVPVLFHDKPFFFYITNNYCAILKEKQGAWVRGYV